MARLCRSGATTRTIAPRISSVLVRAVAANRQTSGRSAAVRAAGGLWTQDDLAAYAVAERLPLRFSFRGARIVTAPLPSSGGLVMAQALQILEPLPLETIPRPREDVLPAAP